MSQGGPPVNIPNRIPPMMNSSWQSDVTQKISQLPDGTIERHITVDGMETRQRFHSSGAYSEWRPDGTSIHHHANNSHEYAKGGTTMSVDQHGDTKIAGHGRINIDTDGHVEFAKNASIAVNGMAEIAAPKGHIKMSASEIAMSSTQGSISMNAARDFEMKTTAGRMAIAVQGVMTMQTAQGDIHMNAGGSGQFDWTSGGKATMNIGGDFDRNTKGNTNDITQGKGTFQSKGAANFSSTGAGTTVAAKGDVNISPTASTILGGTGAQMPGNQTDPISPTFGS